MWDQFKRLVGGVVSGFKTFIGIVAESAKTVKRQVDDFIRENEEAYRKWTEKYSEKDVKNAKKTRLDQLHQINKEIIELEKKFNQDGSLNEKDQIRLDELTKARINLRKKVDNATEYEAVHDRHKNPENRRISCS